MIINASKNYTSGSVGYRYWGWVNTNTPSNATITALNKDANKVLALNIANTTPTGSQYYVYYHPVSYGNVGVIYVNYFPSTLAFTITTITFNGQVYERIISNNALTKKSTFSFN